VIIITEKTEVRSRVKMSHCQLYHILVTEEQWQKIKNILNSVLAMLFLRVFLLCCSILLD
jgi:hypothetical protein